MPEPIKDIYFYVDPKIITKMSFGGDGFLKEQIDAYISTIKCLKEIINSCVHSYEIETLRHCLLKLRSSIAELNITALTDIINNLVTDVENSEPKEILSLKLKDFLLICELVVVDLNTLKKNQSNVK